MKKYVMSISNNGKFFEIGYVTKTGVFIFENYKASSQAMEAMDALRRYSIIGNNNHLSQEVYTLILSYKDKTITTFDFLLHLFIIFRRTDEIKYQNLLKLLQQFDVKNHIDERNYKLPKCMFNHINLESTFIYLYSALFNLFKKANGFNDDNTIKYFIANTMMLFSRDVPVDIQEDHLRDDSYMFLNDNTLDTWDDPNIIYTSQIGDYTELFR